MSETGLLDMQLAEIIPAIEVALVCFCIFLIAGILYIKFLK